LEIEGKKRIEPDLVFSPQWVLSGADTALNPKKCEGKIMDQIRIVAIPTKVVEAVRVTMRAPGYGFPAHNELGADAAPCRHCLRVITSGVDRRVLFTYDRFAGVESFPLPGPVFIHAEACERYPENIGFPEELRAGPRTLEGYGRGRRLLEQKYVTDGKMEEVIEEIFYRSDVDYIHVNSTTAGCYTFRIERQDRLVAANSETMPAL
jgi:Protein of unknown function (DUF1203)